MADTTNTLKAFRELLRERQGGGLDYAYSGYYSENLSVYQSSSHVPKGYKPFEISIFQSDTSTDLIKFVLIINPSSLSIGNVSLSNDVYTRSGWVSTLWGNQQSTISANGSTAGFYYQPQSSTGITNIKRKDSIAFINLLDLMSLFKNNGANFLRDSREEDLFKSGFSRIINVMDTVKVSYDGSEYIGEFISFTLDESAEKPYSLDYSFEYIIHGISTDSPFIEGHVRTEKYDSSSPINISIQGEGETLKGSLIDEAYIISSQELIDGAIKDEERSSSEYKELESVAKKLSSGNSGGIGYTPTTLTTEQDALVEIVAHNLGIENAEWLKDLIWFESRNDVFARNTEEGQTAKGLVQFIDSTARELGYTSSSDLIAKNPTFEQQMKEVEKYLRGKGPFEGKGKQYLYMSVFYPKYKNVKPSKIFPGYVQDKNPGIETVQDYLDKVDRSSATRPAPVNLNSSGFVAEPTADSGTGE